MTGTAIFTWSTVLCFCPFIHCVALVSLGLTKVKYFLSVFMCQLNELIEWCASKTKLDSIF